MEKKSNFKFYIQLFGAITVTGINEAIKDCKTPEEIKCKLEELGIVKIQEKPHTKESIQDFLLKNKEVADELYNSNVKHFLGSKLNKKSEEITDEDIKQEIIFKKELELEQGKYKKAMLEQAIKGALGDNAELLFPHVKVESLEIDDNFSVKGLEKEILRLKEKFPVQFEKIDETLPGKGTGKNGGIPNETLEDLKVKAMTGTFEDRIKYKRALAAQEGGDK
ncbi:MAG: hypothetical protein ACRCYA_15340 [Cetobacterium sp.]|uniref:hypothetical protein n=1 Tax=Cetobacterium sp. TaxID=2071632 RepID=UPI003F3F51E5